MSFRGVPWECRDARAEYRLTQQQWLGIMRKYEIPAWWSTQHDYLFFDSEDFRDAMKIELARREREKRQMEIEF